MSISSGTFVIVLGVVGYTVMEIINQPTIAPIIEYITSDVSLRTAFRKFPFRLLKKPVTFNFSPSVFFSELSFVLQVYPPLSAEELFYS